MARVNILQRIKLLDFILLTLKLPEISKSSIRDAGFKENFQGNFLAWLQALDVTEHRQS